MQEGTNDIGKTTESTVMKSMKWGTELNENSKANGCGRTCGKIMNKKIGRYSVKKPVKFFTVLCFPPYVDSHTIVVLEFIPSVVFVLCHFELARFSHGDCAKDIYTLKSNANPWIIYDGWGQKPLFKTLGLLGYKPTFSCSKLLSTVRSVVGLVQNTATTKRKKLFLRTPVFFPLMWLFRYF